MPKFVANTSDTDDLGGGYFSPKYSASELKKLYNPTKISILDLFSSSASRDMAERLVIEYEERKKEEK